jgi:phosphoglycolate phosphatase
MVFKLACLDMAGTTVSDDGAVERAFTQALADMGIALDNPEYQPALSIVKETMGQSKIEVFRLIFGDEDKAVAANLGFEAAYSEQVAAGFVEALPGAEKTLIRLRDAGVALCLTTGFAPVTRDLLIEHLGWADLIDLALTPADVGRGRPFPDMIWAAASRLGVDEIGDVVVAGDTPSDMAAGIASGAGRGVGVQTRGLTADDLRDAGASDVVAGIEDLLEVVGLTAR